MSSQEVANARQALDSAVSSGKALISAFSSYKKSCSGFETALSKFSTNQNTLPTVTSFLRELKTSSERLDESKLPPGVPLPSDILSSAQQNLDKVYQEFTKESVSSGKLLDYLDAEDEEKLLQMLLNNKRSKGKSFPSRLSRGDSRKLDEPSRGNAFLAEISTPGSIAAADTLSTLHNSSSSSSTSNARQKEADKEKESRSTTGRKKRKLSSKKDTSASKVKRDSVSPVGSSRSSEKQAASERAAGSSVVKELLRSNECFRQFVAFELSRQYFEAKKTRLFQVKMPNFSSLDIPEGFSGRFENGLLGVTSIVGRFAPFVADQVLLTFENKGEKAFSNAFPQYEHNFTLARNRFPQSDADLYDQSQSFRHIVHETAKVSPQALKQFIADMDAFSMQGVPRLCSSKSARLKLTLKEKNSLHAQNTFGDLVEFLSDTLEGRKPFPSSSTDSNVESPSYPSTLPEPSSWKKKPLETKLEMVDSDSAEGSADESIFSSPGMSATKSPSP